ncbi:MULTISPECIES: hypothetical protein [unclassified Mesorhizobium]|uniref:hypothetical protein n=1 Tax=unclassified Mesorhizobium TaxID=325217 RepID=UPI0011263D6B|nr:MULTISPECIES: hypothetical protein [unclassified Mesorhizobium]MBZ9974385.1 hypothetical protein [Mesorhizobium sp. BR-1-1-10]TPL64092.1 hypothetical protein FJ954_29710 [Mesorhizobium sp. B2-3-15]
MNTDGSCSTNLQLYALLQAKRYWNVLAADYLRDKQDTNDLVERCVFIVATLGLSVSQLLGQNDPAPTIGKIASPRSIWKRFVAKHGVTDVSTDEFEKFMEIYDACRHFGVSPDGLGHSRLEQLDFETTRRWYNVAHLIWLAVIKALRADPQNVIDVIEVDGFEV